MISTAGIALFVFGNRRTQAGDFEPAAGVQEEFDLALELGVALLPIAATESKARELHDFVMARFGELFGNSEALRKEFSALGDNVDPATLTSRVLSLVKALA
jgi:hypothetical protein